MGRQAVAGNHRVRAIRVLSPGGGPQPAGVGISGNIHMVAIDGKVTNVGSDVGDIDGPTVGLPVVYYGAATDDRQVLFSRTVGIDVDVTGAE
ncbi:hypothetical protein ES707_11976 [subsurface metagenome]